MTKRLLLTRPDHDYATRYLSAWAEKFFDLAKKKGCSIIDLRRERANYKDDFILIYLEECRTRPAEDKLAGLFLDPSNLVASSLLKGHTAGKSVLRARQEFFRNIQKLLTSKTKTEDSSILRYLLWDMKNLTLCGNGDKKI